MKIYCRPIFSVLLILTFSVDCYCQDTAQFSLEVGKHVPRYTIHHIEHDSLLNINIDNPGKWLLIDIWSKYCTGCIESMPKMSRLQESFRQSVRVLYLGWEDKEGAIQKLYGILRRKQAHVFSVAFDSVFCKLVDPHAVPFILLIDPDGVLRAMTTSIPSASLNSLLHGQTPVLEPAQRNFVLNNLTPRDFRHLNSNNDPAFSKINSKSEIFPWDPTQDEATGPGKVKYSADSSLLGLQVNGAELKWLFNFAYFGKTSFYDPGDKMFFSHWYQPIFELEDSSTLSPDWSTGRNVFNVEFVMRSSRDLHSDLVRLMDLVKATLLCNFGFKGIVEERKMPCFKLLASPNSAALLHNNVRAYPMYVDSEIPHFGYEVYGAPIDKLIQTLFSEAIAPNFPGSVLIDETHIKGSIDIKIDCFLRDIKDVNEALSKFGLKLVPAFHQVKTLKLIPINSQRQISAGV